MKLILLISIQFLIRNAFSCTNDIDLLSGNTVTLTKSAVGQLCTLTKIASDGNSFVPVGRSYENGDWEAVAGPYATLTYSCATDCTVTLPSLETGETFQLSISTFTLSKTNELARFLEQATFGTTRAALAEFDDAQTATDNIRTWIHDQIYNVNMTSHREWVRKRSNHRFRPDHLAVPYHACESGTRYRVSAFSSKDYKHWLNVKQVENKIVLSIGGHVRAVVDSINWYSDSFRTSNGDLETTDHAYEFCTWMDDYLGMAVSLRHSSGSCQSITINGEYGNPLIAFYDDGDADLDDFPLPTKIIRLADSTKLKVINQQFFPENWLPNIPNNYGNEQEFQLTEDLTDILCDDIANEYDGVPVFIYRETEGDYLIHDPPPKALENTLENPAFDGGAESMAYANGYTTALGRQTLCSNAPRSFLNEEYCKLSTATTACGPETSPSITINLNHDTLRTFYTTSMEDPSMETRYVYAIDDLRIDDDSKTLSPCQAVVQSRWVALPAGTDCTNDLQTTTINYLANLHIATTDTNAYVRDIVNEASTGCHVDDRTKTGFKLEVTEDSVTTCWEHVHQHYLQVFDMTYWTYDDTHPGNSASRNPIKEFAEAESSQLLYPSWHGMDRWITNYPFFTEIGRFGDDINYAELPASLRSSAMADAFNGTVTTNHGAGVVICGSPFEVANDVDLGGGNGYGGFDFTTDENRTTGLGDNGIKKLTAWTEIALHSEDQLRQKMAWALSKVITFADSAVTQQATADMFTSFYDIFVRHAFGNYFDILKEMAHHQIMAQSLSYVNSRSTYNSWHIYKSVTYPDENFAREVMQLFTIGLCQLNLDGTEVMDGDTCVHTYSNDEIVEYARAWTGFERRDLRGNIETEFALDFVDPLAMRNDWRDLFPKMGLNGEYIGEKYPLCAERPSKHFLKKGAKYILLGSSAHPEQHDDPTEWASDVNAKRVTIEKPNWKWNRNDEFLYTHLCNPDETGTCQFKAVVVLDRNLRCIGIQCKLDTVRVIQVDGLYYEYIHVPCVEKAFVPKALATSQKWGGAGRMCADPRREVASSACCEYTRDTHSQAWTQELYWGERMTFKTAAKRCAEFGYPACVYGTVNSYSCKDGTDFLTECDHLGQYWQRAPCTFKVKVEPESGKVAISHDSGEEFADTAHQKLIQPENAFTYFRVHWRNGNFPTPADMCGGSDWCEVYQNEFCMCKVGVREVKVFNSMPSREDALSALKYGAFDPDILKFKKIDEQNGVSLYAKSSLKPYHRSSIFEVVDDHGMKRYLQNLRSTVSIKGGWKRFSFPNPVSFPNLQVHDPVYMHQETHATLEQYFYHRNTAPFVSKLLINHFGISNPSPAYVKDVATAFQTGTYSDGGIDFGEGKYGDLSAVVAAILLNREARSVVLEKDATFGGFHENLMKIMRFLRAMELAVDPDKKFTELEDMINTIGQMAYKMITVFGFYLPDYAPPGKVSLAGLVGPEAQINAGPNMLSVVNGLYTLIKYGMTHWWDGLFRGRGGHGYRDPGDFSWSYGKISFEPSSTDSSEIVEEMNTLLTSGRMSDSNKAIIKDFYDNQADKTTALMMAQQLFVSAPEFHASGLLEKSGSVRPTYPDPVASTEPYKAVIFLNLRGGVDSHNMLVPQCDPLKSQYESVRGLLALSSSQLLPITVDEGPAQPCTDFGIHKNLPELQRGYNADETLFVANVGVLNAAVDKTNYITGTKTQLFGHNTMQEECQRIDPYDVSPATGVLGRMIDELSVTTGSQGNLYNIGSVSVKSTSLALTGEVGVSKPHVVVKRSGKLVFDSYPWSERPAYSDVNLFEAVNELNGVTTPESSIYQETYASDFLRVVAESEVLGEAIDNATITENFPSDDFGMQMEQVARLIQKADTRGVDREAFFIYAGSFDHHADLNLNANLPAQFAAINNGLAAFWNEMKAQGNFEKVVLVELTDFGRTLTPNASDGSDHAWGGQIFVSGGKVKGGRILGEYPADLEGDLNVDGPGGRGRLIPTTSYDAVFNGIAQWMGVEDEDALNRVLPNRLTCGSPLFEKEDMFVD